MTIPLVTEHYIAFFIRPWDNAMWREYHDATKHTVESLRRSTHRLDWANQPDPFRHYEGVPVLDLPADPAPPDIPALDVLNGKRGAEAPSDGAAFLSQLLFYSAAISASKRVLSTGERYALRVNPSSGNLHPTEFHFITRGLLDWPDGLYHYRPSSHMAEQRAIGSFDLVESEPKPITFLLTSIAWREAWKYQNRAYRYCLHDAGHAWQSLVLSARAIGCHTSATFQFPDDEISKLCGLAEDEWAMLILELSGGPLPLAGTSSKSKVVWARGEPNRLSSEIVPYPLIDRMHAATKSAAPATELSVMPAREVSHPSKPFGMAVRTRRSALNFIGGRMSAGQLRAILASTQGRFIRLYLYVHRVDDMEPGLYLYDFESGNLGLRRRGDQRVVAAGLSLGQDLAGNSCVTFSMIGDLNEATRLYGDRGYRYVHFEAGAIGQQLYVASEAVGLRATGIGAFFDDRVNEYLNLESSEGEVVYHFAIGHPVLDDRLSG